jgi:hypothetical protein
MDYGRRPRLMKITTRTHRLAAAFAIVTSLTLAPAVGARDKETKLERQIQVMERVIDGMLVESPNWLVQGREVSEGFDDEGTGVFFSFEASLTGFGYGNGSDWSFWPFTGKHRIHIRNDDDDDSEDSYDEIRIRDGEIQVRNRGGSWKEIDEGEFRERQAAKYERAKEELVECLMEYGDILRALPAGQSVRIVARLRGLELPKGEDVDKLTLRVGIDDLRAFADGRMTDSEIRSRIEIRES